MSSTLGEVCVLFCVFLYVWVMFRGLVVMGRVRGRVMLLFGTGTLPPPNRISYLEYWRTLTTPELNFKDGCHMCEHYRHSSNILFVSISGYFLLYCLASMYGNAAALV